MNNPVPIEDWKIAALLLYFRVSGRRCVVCSRTVDSSNGKLWELDGEILLTHEGCE